MNGLQLPALLMCLFSGPHRDYTWLEGIANTVGIQGTSRYVVVIDAGSSGSRVSAYKYRYSPLPKNLLTRPPALEILDKFHAATPMGTGLSSFENPYEAANSIVQLLKKADGFIPLEERAVTPLVLRATAGLRLLPSKRSQIILDHVSAAVSKLGYPTGPNSAAILTSAEEGIYGWYTINLLYCVSNATSTAVMDLGGASIQVTYQLDEFQKQMLPIDDQHDVLIYSGPKMEQSNATIFTHSYLKLGLLEARYHIFQMEAGGVEDPSRTAFTSVCLDPISQNETLKFRDKTTYVSGAPREQNIRRITAYNNCYELAMRYVLKTMDWEPMEPPSMSIVGVGFFFDVAADAGIIDAVQGGVATVSKYRASAHRACSASNIEQPWACMDLAYVVALLQDGLKLENHQDIMLPSNLNGYDVSWGLGLAYSLMTQEAN